MNWRYEERPNLNKEKAIKKHIKRELMNYYLYLDKYYELSDKEYPLHNKSVGGSVVQMPDGTSVASDGDTHKTIMQNSEIEMLKEPFASKLNKLDNWMNILTESQHEVIRVYVMLQQCEDVHGAALELRYSEDTIKKYTSRAINRIYSRIKNIL